MGVQVYFCDPRSRWQRVTSENTDDLLRQYFPKGTDLAMYNQKQLDAIATELNGRPRQTLRWMTPSDAFACVGAMTARDGHDDLGQLWSTIYFTNSNSPGRQVLSNHGSSGP